MSADGSIEVSVQAEGVDDAAEELADRDGGGGGDGEGGGGGFGTAIAGGIVGGLVSQLLGPLLDTLDPILEVLNAFLAPLAVLALRLLQPVLRQLVQLLPAWFDFVNEFIPEARKIGQDIVAWIQDVISNLPSMDEVITAINNIDEVAAEIVGTVSVAVVEWAISEGVERAQEAVTGMSPFELLRRASPALFAATEAERRLTDNAGGGQAAQPNVIISGGLEPFVETVESNADVDAFLGG